MDMKKLATNLRSLGLLIVLVAIVWWYRFFGALATEANADLYEALPCMISSSDGCGLAAGLAQLAGFTLYTPFVLWFGVALLVAGFIMTMSVNKEKNK